VARLNYRNEKFYSNVSKKNLLLSRMLFYTGNYNYYKIQYNILPSFYKKGINYVSV
jgi:hypothetical protein